MCRHVVDPGETSWAAPTQHGPWRHCCSHRYRYTLILHCNINYCIAQKSPEECRSVAPHRDGAVRRQSAFAERASRPWPACWADVASLLGQRLHLRLHIVGMQLHHVLGALRPQQALGELQGGRDIALGIADHLALELERGGLRRRWPGPRRWRPHSGSRSSVRRKPSWPAARSARRTCAFPEERKSLNGWIGHFSLFAIAFGR